MRRVGDVIVAAIAVAVAAIPMAIIAAAVKATSRGPIMFTQERVGRHGQLFTIKKFRTMRDGTHTALLNNPDDHQAYIDNNFHLDHADTRITPLGRFLRLSSLDELPQLFNVLAGDMSIVGIRPLVPLELAMRPTYDQTLYKSLRPGLTGLWQTEGRDSITTTNRIKLDRRYIETWSPWTDTKILIRTPATIIRDIFHPGNAN